MALLKGEWTDSAFAETLFDRRPTTLSLSAALPLKENHPRRPTPWLTHSPVRISERRFDLKIDLTLKTGMMWREVAAVKIEGAIHTTTQAARLRSIPTFRQIYGDGRKAHKKLKWG